MGLGSLALVAAVSIAASPAQPTPRPPGARRVAVLELGASWAGECRGATLTDVQRERCDILRLFADEARMGALSVLRPPAYLVMTRENAALILNEMGRMCAEGECEVETARLLGADLVVSGEVTYLESTYVVSLKVHDVATAVLLGGGKTSAKTKLEAFGNIQSETSRMLVAAGLAPAALASPPAEPVEAASPPQPAEPEAPLGPHAPYAGVTAGMFGGASSDANVTQSGTPQMDGSLYNGNGGLLLVRGGTRRVGSRWGWEAEIGTLTVADGSPLGTPFKLEGVKEEITGYFAGGLLVWWPRGGRFFSWALGGGGAFAKYKVDAVDLSGGRAGAQADGVVPYFRTEVRVGYPIGRYTLTASAGGMALFSPKQLYATTASGLRVSIPDGMGVLGWTLGLGTNYHF